MKMNKIILTIVAGVFCFSAYATDMPAKSLPMSTIISNLAKQGYVGVKEIEFKDNVYHVDAVDRQGKEINVDVNPETGVLDQAQKKSMKLTMQEAVRKVEAAGYRSIYFIKAGDDKYEIKGLDKEGKKVSLDVNGNSGEVSKNLF